MQHLQLEDVEIGYHRRGNGPALLLLHGATTSSCHDWSELVPYLEGYEIIALDHRAHGASGGDVDDLSTTRLVDDVEACVDRLHLDRYAVLAASHGSIPAIRLADRRPGAVPALILLGYAPWRPSIMANGPDLIADRWGAELAKLHSAKSPDHWPRLLSRMFADRVQDGDESAGVLSKLSVPTLFAFGDRDPFVPLSGAPALMELVPGSEVFVIPGVGHQPQRRAPELVASGTRRFLAMHDW